MIGRDEQLQEVLQHCGSVLKSTSQENVLFITGEAGIGKSTFLKAVADAATSLQPVPIVVTAQCSTPLAGQSIGEAEALKPWVDAADAIVRQNAESLKNSDEEGFDFKEFFWDTAPAWIELIPVVGSAIGAGVEIITTGYDYVKGNPTKTEKTAGSAMSQQQIFQQYINLLQKISETSPLIIILDDFHWADDSSCNLLFAAARQLQQKPIVFIIAYRPDDALTARDGEGHSILHIKNELERYDFCRKIEVPKFSAENLDEFLRKHYPHYHKDDVFEKWLTHEAGGNALFVIEFLKTLEEDKFIDPKTGIFSGNFDDVEIPKSAFAVIHERIRRLSDDAREFLQYASVEGETFTTAVLSQITELLPLKTLQRLRTIEDKHHIVKNIGKQTLYSHETTAYQFAHALIHRAMYETLEEEERELLHAAILDIVKKEWNEAKKSGKSLTGMANRIAIHAEIAKDYLFAAEVLLKAAEACWKEYAESEAMQNITSSLSLLEKLENQSDASVLINAELLYLRGKIHDQKGRFPKAIEDLTSAGLFFSKCKADTRKVDMDTDIGYVYWRQRRFNESIEKIQEVLSIHGSGLSASQKRTALYYLGSSLADGGRPDEAIISLMEALHLARSTNNRYSEVRILEALGNTNRALKKYDAALQYFHEGLHTAKESNDYSLQAALLHNIANCYYNDNEYDTAIRYYKESLSLVNITGEKHNEANTLANISLVFKDLKLYNEAISYIGRALHIRCMSGDKYGEAVALHILARIYYEIQNIGKAKEYALQSKTLSAEIGDTYAPQYNEPLLKEIKESEHASNIK